jgi:hypothetical protein
MFFYSGRNKQWQRDSVLSRWLLLRFFAIRHVSRIQRRPAMQKIWCGAEIAVIKARKAFSLIGQEK